MKNCIKMEKIILVKPMKIFGKKIIGRYKRQTIIPDFNQHKLEKAKIAIVGLGGIGSAASIYLAAAGIGHIRIIDNDIVSKSDLNRQILYSEKDLGKKKITVAKEKLSNLNSEIEIEAMDKRLNENNFGELFHDVDALLDCTDNFSTRYLINEAAVKLNLPLFYAACREMSGMTTTIIPKKTACIHCIFPIPPEKERETPILGAIAGTIGTIQATEAIKFFNGMQTLQNKLLLYDGRFNRYDIIKVRRRVNCPVCGEKNDD